jgi:hypothetical protein
MLQQPSFPYILVEVIVAIVRGVELPLMTSHRFELTLPALVLAVNHIRQLHRVQSCNINGHPISELLYTWLYLVSSSAPALS